MKNEFVYLAAPYSLVADNATPLQHKLVRKTRFFLINAMAAKLMEQGYLVFSPISHSHPIEEDGMPVIKNGDWWLRQDFAVLKHVDKVMVYKLPGWEKSYGVAKEVEFAKEHNIPVEYIEAD